MIVGENATRFTVHDGGGVRVLSVEGAFEIEDSDPSAGILFSVEGPYPRFFLVASEEFREAIGRRADGRHATNNGSPGGSGRRGGFRQQPPAAGVASGRDVSNSLGLRC